jgi:LysR family hydrogen peroxide-inducible transcriptional activator
MNIQQLEYIIAVDTHKNFVKAANACFVTQPTLSAMIQKLEDELSVKIFDRSSQPITPTETGKLLITQAKKIVSEVSTIKNIALNSTDEIKGELTVGVIPTVAVYLLPILAKATSLYPKLHLQVREMTTESITDKLRSGELDAGILATPLRTRDLTEHALFLEPLRVFVSTETANKKQYILSKEIDPKKVWMLEEGHCLSKQFINYCKLKGNSGNSLNTNFQTGSLDTLLNMVETYKGITLIPELAAQQLDEKRKLQLRNFKAPIPVRQISLVSLRPHLKSKLNEVLKTIILTNIEPLLKAYKLKPGTFEVVAIN